MIIGGFDPGFAFLGAAFIELQPTSTRIIHHETFATKSSDSDEDRLDAIAEHVLDLIEQFEPEAIGYENQAWAALPNRVKAEGEELRTSAASRRLHEVTGLIRCAARCYDTPVFCLAPSTIKVGLLGKGGTKQRGKQAVKDRVRALFGIVCSEHAADAIAVGISTGVRHRRNVTLLAQHASLIH